MVTRTIVSATGEIYPKKGQSRGAFAPPCHHHIRSVISLIAVKIVEVISGFGVGGAERAIAARLARTPSTIDTTIVNIGDPSGPLRDEIATSARLIDLAPYALRRFARTIRSEQPSVILSHTPRAAIFAALGTARMTPRPKLVTVSHGIIIDQRLKRALQALPLWMANRRNDLTVAVSEAVRDSPWTRGSRRIVVVPLGSELVGSPDASVPSEYWSATARVRWLALSRLIPQKNFEALIAAVAAAAPVMRSVGAELSIVGDGSSATTIDRAIASRGLGDVVHRHAATLSPGPLMMAADALVITSFEEGGPLTVSEALLAGTRVMSTPVGVVPALFCGVDDVGLITLPDHRHESIVAGLEHLAALGPCGVAERTGRRQRFAHLHVDHTTARFVEEIERLAT